MASFGRTSGARACLTSIRARACARVQDIKFNVHAHPTLSEVLDELFKAAHVEEKTLVAA